MKKIFNTLKLGSMTSRQLANVTFLIGFFYYIVTTINRYIELYLFTNFGVPAESTFVKIGGAIYFSAIGIKALLGIILFKLLGEIIYKIAEFINCYINNTK